MRFTIEPLSPRHDRSAFTCGQPDLDTWFRDRASQDEKRNLSRVFVASDAEGIAGFYSLSSYTLGLSDLPPDLARKLPRYEAIPAALIGRLARAERVRGQGLGGVLLADAVQRTLSASRSVAVYAILVDAKDEGASTFYHRFGFRSFPLRPDRLFLLTSTARAALDRI
ncbi:MAG: GNAT family N-acetyltransferase [Pseudomonadota bacterium]|nr:GNAT family N-acetyltransferase [Pseudomonadota bacterium]